ncbi:MAG: phage tail assembly chaperone [Pseudolabrys sp.]|nr:phage tail assembly chaperone [Pseudolabrys sp.]
MTPFPWKQAIGFGLGVLKLSPEQFWRDPVYVPYYLIAFGLVTEFLRRRRATDL